MGAWAGKKTKPKTKAAARHASPSDDEAETGGKRKAAPKAKASGKQHTNLICFIHTDPRCSVEEEKAVAALLGNLPNSKLLARLTLFPSTTDEQLSGGFLFCDIFLCVLGSCIMYFLVL